MRQYSYEGLPDELPILRAFLWKILLNYLPEEHKKWEETLLKQRSQYNNYKKFIEGRLQLELKEKKYKSKDTLEQIIKYVMKKFIQNIKNLLISSFSKILLLFLIIDVYLILKLC